MTNGQSKDKSRIHIIASYLRLAAYVPVVAAFLFFIIAHPTASAIAFIQARTEAISYTVVTPQLAQVRLTGFSVAYERPVTNLFQKIPQGTTTPICLSGLLVPNRGTIVTYERFKDGPVDITFVSSKEDVPAVSFDSAAGDVPDEAKRSPWIRLNGPRVAVAGQTSVRCLGEVPSRLPIFGPLELGEDLRPMAAGDEPSSGVLIEGTMNVFAKSLAFGLLGGDDRSIYPASASTIALPAGSRITEYASEDQTRQPWTGFILTNENKALNVRVTTPSGKLAIFLPGGGLKPEVLSISLFTELLNYPTLIYIQAIVAILFSALHGISSALSFFAKGVEADERTTRAVG